jgi:hypothetical protein
VGSALGECRRRSRPRLGAVGDVVSTEREERDDRRDEAGDDEGGPASVSPDDEYLDDCPDDVDVYDPPDDVDLGRHDYDKRHDDLVDAGYDGSADDSAGHDDDLDALDRAADDLAALDGSLDDGAALASGPVDPAFDISAYDLRGLDVRVVDGL